MKDLGSGGMAQVFLASMDGPAGFEKQVVVKRILPEFAGNPSFAEMFITEARVASMMSHPNIVQVFEFAREGDGFFLAMEYVSGATLGRLVAASRAHGQLLGARFAVEVGIGLARALAYAHALAGRDGTPLRIVHRDVSPENVLVSREGAVKLTDFGVAKSEMTATATQAGVVKGKWSYMSPEQVTLRPLDGRSDQFSLAAVLWELLTGCRLFAGKTAAERVVAVLHAEVLPPSGLAPGIPPQLDRILLKALGRNPAARFAGCAELAEALEQLRASEGWTSGAEHLAAAVSYYPRESSPSGAALVPGSNASGLEELVGTDVFSVLSELSGVRGNRLLPPAPPAGRGPDVRRPSAAANARAEQENRANWMLLSAGFSGLVASVIH
ncbi:MAG: serine/threonine protein kinase [Deltaproteobacteria bacterium]|nr:serine/threonine protein kinase [Deltaproteobacteria bacterium]